MIPALLLFLAVPWQKPVAAKPPEPLRVAAPVRPLLVDWNKRRRLR